MTILIYNEANVHNRAMTRAVDEARRIFAAAGINLAVTYDDTASPDLWMNVRLLFTFHGTQKSKDVMGAAPFDKDRPPGRITYAF